MPKRRCEELLPQRGRDDSIKILSEQRTIKPSVSFRSRGLESRREDEARALNPSWRLVVQSDWALVWCGPGPFIHGPTQEGALI
ncbi:hypothetical protein NL676_032767 [Syzygium grande]|nr:hypothetical protein NL676_032767 [Syzygium grande]